MNGTSTRRSLWATIADDGAIIRVAFFAMLAGTLAVLYIDWSELSANDTATMALPSIPILPAFDPDLPASHAGPSVLTDPERLKQPLTAALVSGGVLELTGTIDPGAAERVEAEITARGEYVKVVSLNSPGGSVEEAMRIGALLQAEGLVTRVAGGALCASSCPLVFAGGKTREASRQAAIGVHQIYAVATAGALPTGARAAGEAMADAQRTTAIITRYLDTAGVDPTVWVHALETPPDRLYYLDADEMTSYRLATKLID